MSAPTSAAVPATRPIAEARFWSAPVHLLDQEREVGPAHLVGEDGDAEDGEDAAHGRIREDAPDRTAGQGEGAALRNDRRPDLPGSDHDQDDRPERERGAQPEDRDERQAQAVDDQGAQDGPDREAERSARPEERGRGPHAVARRHVPQRGQHHPGVAQLEADEEEARAELPGLRRKGHAGEDRGLHDGAPHDHGAAAVLVRPDAPERDEDDPEDEDEAREEPREGGDLVLGQADLAEPQGQEGEHLGDPQRLDRRDETVDDEERAPSLDGAGRAGRRAEGRARRHACAGSKVTGGVYRRAGARRGTITR